MTATGRSGAEILVASDAESAAGLAAERVASILRTSIESTGRADWATTGGSTPGPVYRRLAVAPLRESVPWTGLHLWWGDDRFVPSDHPLSNVQAADEILIGRAGLSGESGIGEYATDITAGRDVGAPIPALNVHPFPTTKAIGEGLGPDWCAAAYADELRAVGPAPRDGWPAFDLVLLGIGPDGHLLSVFPGSAALGRPEWALAIPAPTHVEPRLPRVTLNPAIIGVAGAIVVVVNGGAKAGVVARALQGEEEPGVLPARLAARGGATWILDPDAASRLDI
ncbi:MAG TPA: 6-phosphogluconolactonase [Candidatus Limnocylindrales bacterium]